MKAQSLTLHRGEKVIGKEALPGIMLMKVKSLTLCVKWMKAQSLTLRKGEKVIEKEKLI